MESALETTSAATKPRDTDKDAAGTDGDDVRHALSRRQLETTIAALEEQVVALRENEARLKRTLREKDAFIVGRTDPRDGEIARLKVTVSQLRSQLEHRAKSK